MRSPLSPADDQKTYREGLPTATARTLSRIKNPPPARSARQISRRDQAAVDAEYTAPAQPPSVLETVRVHTIIGSSSIPNPAAAAIATARLELSSRSRTHVPATFGYYDKTRRLAAQSPDTETKARIDTPKYKTSDEVDFRNAVPEAPAHQAKESTTFRVVVLEQGP